MLLSRKTVVEVTDDQANMIGHMCYAAYKLWNVCNYERNHYRELNLPVKYPDMYYQKKAHKDDLWFKQLPSQTAQEVCKLLDKSWKSFYTLCKTQGIENPHPPKYKHDNIAITYMQNGLAHNTGDDCVRFTLSKDLKKYMFTTYHIDMDFLYLKNELFKSIDTIKQIKIYPPENNKCEIIIVYEMPDIAVLPDNGKYLSIDLGLHNLFTCFNSDTGETFIVGRRYLSLCRYFDKEIARVQSQWAKAQAKAGVKYPKMSKHTQRLYEKKRNAIHDYLHKVTHWIVTYCKDNDIHTVVIGDITGIREDNDHGSVENQKIHSLPYAKIYTLLEYKLAQGGITLVKQQEAYSSQTSPLKESVCKENAEKSNRVKRGLYKDGNYYWNADCVGAFNILRLYFQATGIATKMDPQYIASPHVAKVAV